jgi:hypothetical protein
MAFGSYASSSEERVPISCLYCQQPLDVPRRALSIVCKHCHKPLKLEDVQIKTYEARRAIDTYGIVTVEKKGSFIGDRVLCNGMIVRGKVRGEIVSRGPVMVGPEAEIKGNVSAPTIAIGSGAVLDGHYEIGPAKGAPESK